MRILGRVLITALLLLLWPALGQAEDFPAKSIRLIVPFPPGGPNDIIARVIGQRMSAFMKQPVVIDNRGGQGGVLGTDAVAKANPDGYTIGIVSAGALAISPTMEHVNYDPMKDLQPVTLVAKVPEMLVVASNVPASNMKELVALAKAQPGKLNFASGLTRQPSAFPAAQMLEMATINAAKAFGLDKEIGSLETGKAADMIAIDLGSYLTQPVYNPMSHLIYAVNRLQVSDVWVAGKQLLKNSQFTQMDPVAIIAKAKYWAQKAMPFKA